MAKRLARDKARHDRAALRAESVNASSSDVSELRTRIAALTECHHIDYDPTDWAAVAARGEVERPVRASINEAAARKALAGYRPSLIERLFGLDQDRRRALTARVAEAASKDEAAYRAARKVADDHNAEVQFAVRLLELDVRTINTSLAENTSLDDVGPAIEGLRLHVPTRGRLVAVVSGLELEDMPDEEIVVSAARAVFRPLSRSAMAELHRRNLCSAALRVAAEVLSACPVEWVEVVLECDITDRINQQVERAPVLHVKIGHRALVDMALETVDPVQAVTDFGARMNWSPAEGCEPIETPDLALPVAA
ncbi:hypothetical protein [Phenylobacterium sp.]|uniref:hypothetical protein n=1 Tax=Phenylobacterium sp. TaxID=1871053 RepID=UPI0035ADB838